MRARRAFVLLAAVMAIVGSGLASANVAAADPKTDNHCFAPSGVDLNEFYGVSHQIIAPFCRQMSAGESWSVTAIWIMNFSFEVVPAGFVPAGATPLDDFLAKFVGVKYVIDPGTAQEKTYLFKNKRHLWIGNFADGRPLVNTVTMGTLQPLSVGTHVVRTSWLFSAMHCDGLGDVMIANCIPAGETVYSLITVDVTA